MEDKIKKELENAYKAIINAWNERNAKKMAYLFMSQGELIGFDGSQIIGAEEIYSHLQSIFNDHPTPPFTTKIKNISVLSPVIGMVRAIAGMVPEGETYINPDLNTHHTLIAIKEDKKWKIKLFQNTPAQFHGRPELVEEIRKLLRFLITQLNFIGNKEI